MRAQQAVGKKTLQTTKYWARRRVYISSPAVKVAHCCSLGDFVA